MMIARPSKPTRAGGFTLIELLLVMVILVILAGVVVSRFGTSQDKAKYTKAKVDIAALKQAIQSFKVTTGRYPTTEEGLNALMVQPTGTTGAAADWPFVEAVPTDPWGNAYIYRWPATSGIDFDLLSGGPDGHEGGNDDITSWQQ